MLLLWTIQLILLVHQDNSIKVSSSHLIISTHPINTPCHEHIESKNSINLFSHPTLSTHFLNPRAYQHTLVRQVKAASRLEEEFQVEIWGVVEGGACGTFAVSSQHNLFRSYSLAFSFNICFISSLLLSSVSYHYLHHFYHLLTVINNHQTIQTNTIIGHDMDRLNNAVNLGAVGYFMGLLYDQVNPL